MLETMTKIRPPNVAGSFYPNDEFQLRNLIQEYLKAAPEDTDFPQLKALIAPHAGYVYSGPIAATAYQYFAKVSDKFTTVAILSPSHYASFNGIATCSATNFKTPLGIIPVAVDIVHSLQNLASVRCLDEAFEKEHALEVHLPFLQTISDQFQLVPLIVGPSSPAEVRDVLNSLDDGKTFFVVSSDLSHFENYDDAQEIDGKTCRLIEHKEFEKLGPNDACGYYPLRGLLLWAREKGFKVQTADYRNSGDTAGDKESVVGYAAYLIG